MEAEKTEGDVPAGVGGWLAFRIVQVTVLNPLWLIAFHPGSSHPSLLMMNVLIVLLGFGSGIALVLEVPIALRFVALHLGVWMLYALFLICYEFFLKPNGHPVMTVALMAANFAMYFAWFLYFRRSVRVRNTFGRNL